MAEGEKKPPTGFFLLCLSFYLGINRKLDIPKRLAQNKQNNTSLGGCSPLQKKNLRGGVERGGGNTQSNLRKTPLKEKGNTKSKKGGRPLCKKNKKKKTAQREGEYKNIFFFFLDVVIFKVFPKSSHYLNKRPPFFFFPQGKFFFFFFSRGVNIYSVKI